MAIRPNSGGDDAAAKRAKVGAVLPVAPAKAGVKVALPADPHVERLRSMRVWQVAYMRDVTRIVHHSIEGRGLAPGVTMVGRAFTVSGPDIYLDALESVGPGDVYVQGGCNDSDAHFSPGWTSAYLVPRGACGAVVDGGVYKSYECAAAPLPIFSRFVSPSPAINRRNAPELGGTVVVGGVSIRRGDIVMGDADGVIVIPQEHEDDLFAGLDGFVHANGMFGKVAAQRALDAGVPLTQEPGLAVMFERKYKSPDSYWREYEGWWREVGPKYPGIADAPGTASFYSGAAPQASKS